MSEIDEKLIDFKKQIQELENKIFDNFEDMETAYCNAINQGTQLRNYIINHPDICDENTLKVLTNQSRDFSLMEEKFRCVYSVITLTQKLLENYARHEKECEEKGDFETAIGMYNQMFKFTGNYFYKINIANIYENDIKDRNRAMELYKEAEPHLSNFFQFWWRFAIIYENNDDYYNALLCAQKAVKLELENVYDKGEGVKNA